MSKQWRCDICGEEYDSPPLCAWIFDEFDRCNEGHELLYLPENDLHCKIERSADGVLWHEDSGVWK